MSSLPKIPKVLLARVKAVSNKRARFVLDTIVRKGSCSTADLKEQGYDHPPRAARDAVELGFALKRTVAKRQDGQQIAAYVFDERELDPNKTGRVVMAKKERDSLIQAKGNCCNACGAQNNLQIDHRIPFEVAGESQRDAEDPYQVLDGTCNRRKSWACEHCENWLSLKDFETCMTCYWASPNDYKHVAMRPERRVDIIWTGEELKSFESLEQHAAKAGRSVSEEIKRVLKQK